MKNNKHIVRITIGFFLVITLMTTVIFYSTNRMNQTNEHLQQDFQAHVDKTSYVLQMRDGMLKRFASLRNLSIMDDPFAIDEERMLYYSYARKVEEGISGLQALKLNEQEKRLFDNFLESARDGTSLQYALIDELIQRGNAKSLQTRFKSAFDSQEQTMLNLTRFIKAAEVARQKATQTASEKNQSTNEWVTFLSYLGICLGLLTAIYVIRSTSNQTSQIEDERKKFKSLFWDNMDAVFLLEDGRIKEWNQCAESMFKIERAEQARNIRLMQFSSEHLHDSGDYHEEWLHHCKNSETQDCIFEWHFQSLNGISFDAEVNMTPIELSTRKIVQVVIRDISDRKRVEEQMQYQASYDALTGLPNRTLFRDRLHSSVDIAERRMERLALCFVDLDHFKQVNDTFGHAAGDQLLMMVSERLGHCVRKSDTVARLGGDEFTVILNELHDYEDAGVVAKKIIQELTRPFFIDETEIYIGASIGITTYPTDASSPEALLCNADIAMYQAKQAGRNCYRFFTRQMNSSSIEKMTLEQDLCKALENNELILHYQPIIDIHTNTIVGAEVLTRWFHPEKGLIPPNVFIPVAEQKGLIGEISRWIFHTACYTFKEWQTNNMPDLRLSINLSAKEGKGGITQDYVESILEQTGIRAEKISFELTETELMEDTDKSLTWLQSIKDTGVNIALDDFGTGYSSLAYLKRFPIDTLKIDRSFVQDVCKDKDDQSIVEAITAMAQSLDLNLIAEGIEEPTQLDYFRDQAKHCNLFQGYYFSKPLPYDEFMDYALTYEAA